MVDAAVKAGKAGKADKQATTKTSAKTAAKTSATRSGRGKKAATEPVVQELQQELHQELQPESSELGIPESVDCRVTIAASKLKSILSSVSAALPSKSDWAILTSIYIEISGNRLIARTFDQAIGVESSTQENAYHRNPEKTLKTCVPGKKLITIAGILAGDLTLDFENTDNEQRSLKIKSSTGEYSIQLQDATDYPELPIVDDGQRFSLTAEAWENVSAIAQFASKDAAKGLLQAIHLSVGEYSDGEGFLKATASDSVVVARETVSAQASEKFEILIPAVQFQKIRFDSPIEVFFHGSHVEFRAVNGDESLSYTIRTVEGRYVPIDSIFDRLTTAARFNTDRGIIDSLSRISVIAEDTNNLVNLNVIGEGLFPTLKMSALAADRGVAGVEQISVNLEEGNPPESTVNIKSLLPMIKSLDGDLHFFSMESGANKPIVVCSSSELSRDNFRLILTCTQPA